MGFDWLGIPAVIVAVCIGYAIVKWIQFKTRRD